MANRNYGAVHETGTCAFPKSMKLQKEHQFEEIACFLVQQICYTKLFPGIPDAGVP